MTYSIASALKKNNITNYYKPIEDYLIANKEKGLFIIADGVSRDYANGKYPNPSPAADVAKITCHIINSLYNSNTRYSQKEINDLFLKANNEIKKYNRLNNYTTFLPGTVLIVGIIENDMIHISYIGDCSAYLVRRNKLQKITKSQTKLIRKHSTEFSKSFIRNTICNNLKHPYAYGVLNGDNNAEKFIEYISLKMEQDDLIVLSSDGLDNLFDNYYHKIDSFDANSLIIKTVEIEANKSDDKAVITIKKEKV